MFGPESELSQDEQSLAAKMISSVFEQQLHPIILVRALVVNNPENIAWRKKAAETENVTEAQLKKIGFALMAHFKIILTPRESDQAGLN